MPTFFQGARGRTAAIKDDHAQGTTTLVKTDPELTWEQHRSIITRVTLSHQGNFQFLHTIGNDVYIYVFGDRIGQATISGLSMVGEGSPGSPCTVSGQHGIEKVNDWYKENRVANKKAPIKLTIGKTQIDGFVTAFSADLVDPATRIIQYNLQMVVLPEKT